MNNSPGRGTTTISNDLTINPPREQRGYPISEFEWRKLKKQIDRLKNTSKIWATLWGCFLGGFISCAICWLTLETSDKKLFFGLLSLTILTAILSIVFFILDTWIIPGFRVTTVDDILEDMNDIEAKYDSENE